MAFDGDETTAWCEGVDGPGVGESLSVVLRLPEGMERLEEYCEVHGFALGYGDTHDAASYGASGRVRQLRVSPCDAE